MKLFCHTFICYHAISKESEKRYLPSKLYTSTENMNPLPQYWYNLSIDELRAQINDFAPIGRSFFFLFFCYLSKWINLFPHFYLLKSIIIVSSKCISCLGVWIACMCVSDHWSVLYTWEKFRVVRDPTRKLKTLFQMINILVKNKIFFSCRIGFTPSILYSSIYGWEHKFNLSTTTTVYILLYSTV